MVARLCVRKRERMIVQTVCQQVLEGLSLVAPPLDINESQLLDIIVTGTLLC